MNLDRLSNGYKFAMQAKKLVFKAQDEINHEEGLEAAEGALREIRSKLEAFDRLCRCLQSEGKQQ